MVDDATLLRDYATTGAQGAFAELVRRHLDLVYSAALRRVGGDAHLAQDVAQLVFVALAQRARELSRHPHLAGWLYVATQHEAANTVRRERHRKTREQEAHAMQELSSKAEEHVDWSRLGRVIDATIDELDDLDRSAVLARYFERRSFAEIGRQLRLSEDAARMRVTRALDTLRRLLARRGVASSSAALATILEQNAVAAAPASLAAAITGGALVATPAVGFSLAALCSVIASTKLFPIAALLAVLTATGFIANSALSWRETEAAVETLRRSNETLAANLRAAEQRAAASQTAVAELEASVAKRRGSSRGATAPVSAAGSTSPRPSAPNSLALGRAFMVRHPEVKQATLAAARARLAETYGPLLKARAFTSEQRAEIERSLGLDHLMVRHHKSENGELLLLVGPYSDSPASQTPNRGLQSLEPELAQLALTSIEQKPARQLAQQLAGALAFTSTPLTPEQAQRLVPLATATRDQGDFDWPVLVRQTAGLLSEPQLAALSGLQAEEESRQASLYAARLLHDASRNNAARGSQKASTP